MKNDIIVVGLLMTVVLLSSGCTGITEPMQPQYDYEDWCSEEYPEPKEIRATFATASDIGVQVEHRFSWEFYNETTRDNFYWCRYTPGCWIGKFADLRVDYAYDGFNWTNKTMKVPRCSTYVYFDFIDVDAYWKEEWECLNTECTKRIRVKNLIGRHREKMGQLCASEYITVDGFKSVWSNCTITIQEEGFDEED